LALSAASVPASGGLPGNVRFRGWVNYIVVDLATCNTRERKPFVTPTPNGRDLFTTLKQRVGRNQSWVQWYSKHKRYAGLWNAYQL
jgi:hypothetical protein